MVPKLQQFFRRGSIKRKGDEITLTSGSGRVATVKPYKGNTLIQIPAMPHSLLKTVIVVCNQRGCNMSEVQDTSTMKTSKSLMPVTGAKWKSLVSELTSTGWKSSALHGLPVLQKGNTLVYYFADTQSITAISMK